MGEIKTVKTHVNVNTFIQSIADEQKRIDCNKLVQIMENITSDKAAMWGSAIIGFGEYTYQYQNGRRGQWFKLGFSPRQQNITIYIMCGMDCNQDMLTHLGKHSVGKSCLYIQKLADVNSEILYAILSNSVKRLIQSEIVVV